MDTRLAAQLDRTPDRVVAERDRNSANPARRTVAAAPSTDVVAQPRPQLSAKSPRHLRLILRAAEGSDGALRRREDGHAGARAHASVSTRAARAQWPPGVRVQAARHTGAHRRVRYTDRAGFCPLRAKASREGLASVHGSAREALPEGPRVRRVG